MSALKSIALARASFIFQPPDKLLIELDVHQRTQLKRVASPDEVRTFYVEHDINGSEENTSVLQFYPR